MAKQSKPMPIEIEDSSELTDEDWLEINKLRQGWENAGQKGLKEALAELSAKTGPLYESDAHFPDMVANAIDDGGSGRYCR